MFLILLFYLTLLFYLITLIIAFKLAFKIKQNSDQKSIQTMVLISVDLKKPTVCINDK